MLRFTCNIRSMRLCLVGLLVVIQLHGHQVQSEECDVPSPRFFYPRVYFFILKYDPEIDGTYSINKTTQTLALGSCAESVDAHVERVANYFETKLGINLDAFRESPYKAYETRDLIIAPDHSLYRPRHRLISESFYQNAKFRNSKATSTFWSLIAKANLTTPSGVFSEGHVTLYNMIRFKVHGREFCVQVNERAPYIPALRTKGGAMFDVDVYNEHWGHGEGKGLIIERNGESDVRFTFVFPGDIGYSAVK